MSDLIEFISNHEKGGQGVVDCYQTLLVAQTKNDAMIAGMQSLNGTGDWALLRHESGIGPVVELLDGDEPWIGSMGNATMEAKSQVMTHLRALVQSGWADLPRVRNLYDRFIQQPFPEEYKGVSIPAEYQTIDSQFLNQGPRMLE